MNPATLIPIPTTKQRGNTIFWLLLASFVFIITHTISQAIIIIGLEEQIQQLKPKTECAVVHTPTDQQCVRWWVGANTNLIDIRRKLCGK